MKIRSLVVLLTAGAGLLAAGPGLSLTPAELEKLQARREAVTVLDVRSPSEFAEAHVPGAMNVPAALLERKHLPALGRVVVCGDALRPGEVSEAVAGLNGRPGIRAEALEGGIGAWEEANLASTREGGMHPEKLRYVTYQELQQAAGEAKGLVLVDLREAPAEAGDSASGQGQGRVAARKAAGRTAESDLGRRFAGTEQVRPPRERSRDGKEEASVAALPRSKDPGRVFVLVDDGNGEAEKVARRIRAAGLGQAVILAGGSQAIERDGQPGRRSQEVKARR